MNRRTLIASFGSLTAGSVFAVGSGAFTSVSAERQVKVQTAGDDNALLQLEPSDTVYGRKFASLNGQGLLELDFGPNGRGQGLGTDSEYNFDDVFTVTNQGTQTVYVWATFDTSGFGDGTIWFYPDSDPETRLNDGTNSVIEIGVGETVRLGVHIDTDDVGLGETTLATTIYANTNKPSDSSSTTGGAGPFAPSGLVARYPFNGNANDVTGNGYDATTGQNVTYVDGKLGDAASFNGNAYAEVPDSPGLDLIGDSFAISLWMRTTSDSRGGLIRKNQSNSWQPVYGVEYYYRNNRQIRFLLSDTEGVAPDIDSTTQVGDGQWHHVVAMYDDAIGEMSLYIDGMREGTNSISVDPVNTDGDVQFGRMVNGNRITGQLDGEIDDVRIYDRILSDSEISQLANA